MRERVINLARLARHSARGLLRAAPLPVFALLLLVGMWIALFHQIEVEREATRSQAVAHSRGLAHTLAEYAGGILRKADHATQLFKLKYEESGGALRLPEFMRPEGLMDGVLPLALKLPVALIDKDGNVRGSAHQFRRDKAGVDALIESLAGHASDTARFSTPLLDPDSGQWLIQVARRLNDRDGKFAGAIVIMIDPRVFVDDYDRLNLDDDGAIVLVNPGARLVVGRAGERVFVGKQPQFSAADEPGRHADEVVPNTALDKVPRIYSYREMARYSLVAVVGIPESSKMNTFERHRSMYTWIALAATTLILAVVALLMRQSARLHASMRAAHEAQAMLRAASEGSLDGVLFLKAWRGASGKIEDFICVDMNDKLAAMAGLARSGMIGAKVFALLPQYRTAGLFERYLQVMDRALPVEEELELRFAGEAPRWLYYQIVPLEDGVAVTARDITERKVAELQIRKDRSFLQSLVEHLPLLICVKSVRPDSFGTMLVWNRAAETITGYSAERVVGKIDKDVFPPGFALHDAEEDLRMLANPTVVDMPERLLSLTGRRQCFLHTVSVPLLDDEKRTEYILCIAEDVTQRLRQEQTLRANAAELAAVTDASPLGMLRGNKKGECTYVNQRFETLTGLTRKQSLGDGWVSALHPEDRKIVGRAIDHLRKSSETFDAIVRCRHRDGTILWASIKISAIRIDGTISGYVGTFDDISTLRSTMMALRESEARLRTIANKMPAMVAYLDADQVYRFLNQAYEQEFARDGIDVLGMTSRALVGDARHALLEPYILRALAGETLVFEEHDAGDGDEHSFEVTYIPQLGDDNVSVVGFHVMRQDITQEQREKKRLLKLAQVDALTSLTNRAGFIEKLSEAMQSSAGNGHLMALMYMDIDHFKPVNDTYGHDVGDQLLKAFSARLAHTLRATDTVARLGGDEFTIIMEQVARPEIAAAVAAKIVAAMRAPFELDEVTVSISTSIGLAFYRDGALAPDQLLKRADLLLYEAKAAGRDTYRAAEPPAPLVAQRSPAQAKAAL